MQYFVVFITKIATDSDNTEIQEQHNAFLNNGIKNGRIILYSPSTNDGSSLFLATAASHADLASYLETNPFWITGLTEFDIQEVSSGGISKIIENQFFAINETNCHKINDNQYTFI